MRKPLRIQLILLLLLLTSIHTAVAQQSVIIRNANIIPMTDESVLMQQDVLIQNDRVTAIMPAGIFDNQWQIQEIDAENGFLLPGLAEMHAHIPAQTAGEEAISDTLKLYLANGIVLARGMLGEPAHLELRAQLAAGSRVGPELITSGPSLNGQSVSSSEQAARIVREQHAAGYDFIKLHPGLSRDQYQAAVTTGKRLGIPLGGHVSNDVGLDISLTSHQATIDHLDGYAQALLAENDPNLLRDPGFFGVAIASTMQFDQIDRLARQTASESVWLVPTETIMLNTLGSTPVADMLAWPEMQYTDQSTLDRWRDSVIGLREQYSKQDRQQLLAMRQQLLLSLHQNGAGLLLGSDAPQIFNVPGFSIHREMHAMVEAGLTPYEVLSMGTRNAGEFLKREKWGTIQAGAPASLLLVRSNPLDSIDNMREVIGVMHLGEWQSRAVLDSWLADIAATH